MFRNSNMKLLLVEFFFIANCMKSLRLQKAKVIEIWVLELVLQPFFCVHYSTYIIISIVIADHIIQP